MLHLSHLIAWCVFATALLHILLGSLSLFKVINFLFHEFPFRLLLNLKMCNIWIFLEVKRSFKINKKAQIQVIFENL